MLYGLKTGSIDINNTTMDYAEFGKGTTPIIIIPGLTLKGVRGSEFPLMYEYHIFAKEYRVYVFDKRNIVPDGFTVRDLSEDIFYCIKKLNIPSAHIFGVSLGGMIAIDLAINHPECVNSLILAVTSSRSNHSIESSVRKWICFAENEDLDGIIKDMMPKMYSEKYMKKYRFILPILGKLTKLDYARFINLAKSCITVDCYDSLDKIICPTLILGGMKDRITTPAGSMEIAEKMGCEIYMYEDYGHAAYEEAKDFNKRIYEFIKKVL